MRSNSELQSGQDEFVFRWAESAGAGLGGTVDVRPVGVEQSNSSIVFGEDADPEGRSGAWSRA